MAERIRKATTADLPAIRQLLVETWHATYDNIYGAKRVTEITDDWHSLSNLAVHLERATSVFLLAETGHGVEGTSLARDLGNDLVMLDRLYIKPQSHRRGLGRALLAATLAHFPHAQTVRLEVEPQNTNAVQFYLRQGFAVVSTTSDCGGRGAAISARIMERGIAFDH